MDVYNYEKDECQIDIDVTKPLEEVLTFIDKNKELMKEHSAI